MSHSGGINLNCNFLMIMLGTCVTSLVLSHRSKNLKQRTDQCYTSVWFPRFCLAAGKIWIDRPVLQLCVTAQFHLASKGKYILKAWGQANPSDAKKRGALTQFWLLFLCVFSPPPEPTLCKLGFPRRLFVLPEPHSSPQTFLCSIFTGFSLLFLLSTTMLDSFFLF